MDIEKRVMELLAEWLGQDIEKITLDANLVDDLGADSLDAVEVGMALEDEFEIPDVSDDDVLKWKTVSDVVDCVQRLTLQEVA